MSSEIIDEEKVAAETSSPEQTEDYKELASDREESEDLEASAQSSEEVESIEGSELDAYESADIEEKEFLSDEQIMSIVESVLFATDRPVSVSTMKQAFKGTQVKTSHIRKAIEALQVEYASATRGVSIEEIRNGYHLRTKVDNMPYMKSMVKARPFKLSGPALEVLAILAYKQPCIKAQVDEVRGVESGHLVRALMEKGLIRFAGKSDAPGKPMLYETTGKFLEIFGLRNLRELPSLSEIDDLIPEGIGEVEEEEKLGDITESMSNDAAETYSEGEEELMKISDELSTIHTSSDFFEQEKERQRERREQERAQDIREALEVGEPVEDKDKKWLERYEARLKEEQEVETSQAEPETAEQHTTETEGAELIASENDKESDVIDASEESLVSDKEPAQEESLSDKLEATDAADPKIGGVSFKQLEKDLEIFDDPDDEVIKPDASPEI